MKSVVIDGVTYQATENEGDTKIVVVSHGFVLVGRVTLDGDFLIINDCRCVRFWGASRGLGELAAGGPTGSSKLDCQPSTKVHQNQVVMVINCNEEKWGEVRHA